MWSELKAAISQMSQGARLASLAGVAAVALIGYNAWRVSPLPSGTALPLATTATGPINAEIVNTSKPNKDGAPQEAAKPATPNMPAASAEKPAAAATTEPALKPSFDIARVEPDGATLVAGRALPNSNVDLIDGGKIIGSVKTDAAGQFVILPQGLSPGSHLLALANKAADGSAVGSEQSITVIVPETKKEEVIVALTVPGQATKLLSDEKPAAIKPATSQAPLPSKPAFEGNVLIRTVEAGEGGALFATGSAPPGAEVQLYLSGTLIAKAIAALDGHWSLKVEKGMKPGAYRVRADALNLKGEVLSRAEVPFDFPAENVAATPTATASPKVTASATVTSSATLDVKASAPQTATAAPVTAGAVTPKTEVSQADSAMTPAIIAAEGSNSAAPADAVVAQLETAKVSRGDSLWRISRKVYGKGLRYTQIYEANTKQIRDPRLIYPGQVLVLPADTKAN